MHSPRDPATEEIEDQERLEQFLAWRREVGRRRRPSGSGMGRRWFTYGVGAGVLGTIFVALASLLNGDLGAGQRLTGPASPVSIASLPEPSRSEQPTTPGSGRGVPGDPGAALPAASPSGELLANESGADVGLAPLARRESTRAPAQDVGPAPPSVTSPSLSLPARTSRGERRPPSGHDTLGEPGQLHRRPPPPVLESRGEPATSPSTAALPTTAPAPTPPVNPASIAPPPTAPPSARSEPERPRERPAAVPPPEVAEKPFPEPIETLKRLVESVTDGKVGTSIRRWVTPDREAETVPSRGMQPR